MDIAGISASPAAPANAAQVKVFQREKENTEAAAANILQGIKATPRPEHPHKGHKLDVIA